MWRRALVCTAGALLLGCTRVTGGLAQLPATETPGPMLPDGVDVEKIVLDSSRMRGITGADEHLTIIPSMDAKAPTDISPLAQTVPPPCRFVYVETATFGTDFSQFHKITFQYPPKGALISEAAVAYPDADAARGAFDALVRIVADCADTLAGEVLVGNWDADAQSLRTRAGRCGNDYRLKAAVLLEVTFCGFPESVSDLVLTNLAAGVPG